MLNTSPMMLNILASLIYVSVFLVGLLVPYRQERRLIYLCVPGTLKVVDFRKCWMNECMPILTTCMCYDFVFAHLTLSLSSAEFRHRLSPAHQLVPPTFFSLSLSHWQPLLQGGCLGLKLGHFDLLFLSHVESINKSFQSPQSISHHLCC